MINFVLWEVRKMSDFMKWLYANYITPQINAASQEDYEAYFSLMENTL